MGGLCEYGCVYLYAYVWECSVSRRTRRGQRNGQMEARSFGWMDVGMGGTPFEIQPCSIFGKGGGRLLLSAFEPNAAFNFQGCRLSGGFQNLVGYQTEA